MKYVDQYDLENNELNYDPSLCFEKRRILLEKYTMEDIRNYHLDVPIEILSRGGCTPKGILKKTAGMEHEDIKKADLPCSFEHYFNNLNRR